MAAASTGADGGSGDRWRAAGEAGVVAVVVWTILKPISVIGVDAVHDGWIFPAARGLAEGATLYAEVGTGYGGLTTVIQGWSMRLFGVNWPVFKYSAVVAYALAAALFHLACRRPTPTWWLFGALAVWLSYTPAFQMYFLAWASVYVLVFQALVLIALRRWCEGSSRIWLVIAGGVAALAIFVRQPVGVFLFAALIAFLAFACASRLHARGVLHFRSLFVSADLWAPLLGAVIALSLWLGWVASLGGLADLWRQDFLLPSSWVVTRPEGLVRQFVRMFYPRAAAGQGEPVYALLPLLVLFFWGRALVQQWRQGCGPGAATFALAALFLCAASWLQYFPVSDRRHTYWAMTPFFWTLPLVTRLAVREGSRAWLVPMLAAILIGLPGIVTNVSRVPLRMKNHSIVVEDIPVLRGVHLSRYAARSYRRAWQIMQAVAEAEPNRRFVQGPGSTAGLWYSLVPRPGSFGHPMFTSGVHNSYGPVYPDRQRAFAALLEKEKPFVVSTAPLANENYDFLDLVPPTTKVFSRVQPGTLGVPKVLGHEKLTTLRERHRIRRP